MSDLDLVEVLENTRSYMNVNQSLALIAITQAALGHLVDSAVLHHLDVSYMDVLWSRGDVQTNLKVDWQRPVSSVNEFRRLFSDMYLDALNAKINENL